MDSQRVRKWFEFKRCLHQIDFVHILQQPGTPQLYLYQWHTCAKKIFFHNSLCRKKEELFNYHCTAPFHFFFEKNKLFMMWNCFFFLGKFTMHFKDCSSKFRSKHSSNTVLCLLRNLLEQSLEGILTRQTVYLLLIITPTGHTLSTFFKAFKKNIWPIT